ncbi:hypothetical protein GCM10022287_20030 [Gryllotalpicola koreensis]|uniref:FXSXX-COOH protein n=1 Tax=Gryllotalpicola koreensis TaxID=993086 RepID=A0ABP8A0T0_9MICO
MAVQVVIRRDTLFGAGVDELSLDPELHALSTRALAATAAATISVFDDFMAGSFFSSR